MPKNKEVTRQEMKECAVLCTDCSLSCAEAMSQCLEMGGRHGDGTHIALLALCSDICAVSSRALLYGSQMHEHTCRAAGVIAGACAVQCEGFEDYFMQKCAEVCRQCVASCKKMAGKEWREALNTN